MRGGVDNPLRTKKIVFLVRHPCDIAVSEYFQSTRRARSWKREVNGVDDELSMFDFVMRGRLGLPAIVGYLNAWEQHLAALPNVLWVRYEDMRAPPLRLFGHIVEFLGERFSSEEIADAVGFASSSA